MPSANLFVSPIALPALFPSPLPSPKFQIGQEVLWVYTPTHGFGQIIGLIFAGGTTVRATGYHYAIRLALRSPSSEDCAVDWAFEEDLELLATHAYLLQGAGATETMALF